MDGPTALNNARAIAISILAIPLYVPVPFIAYAYWQREWTLGCFLSWLACETIVVFAVAWIAFFIKWLFLGAPSP
jgi:hypothetical protein